MVTASHSGDLTLSSEEFLFKFLKALRPSVDYCRLILLVLATWLVTLGKKKKKIHKIQMSVLAWFTDKTVSKTNCFLSITSPIYPNAIFLPESVGSDGFLK